MKLDISEWRGFYDNVKCSGMALTDSCPTFDKDKTYIPPINPLSREDQKSLELNIKDLLDRCRAYLDICGVHRPTPLWKYNSEDKTTWASHESFRFGHLIK